MRVKTSSSEGENEVVVAEAEAEEEYEVEIDQPYGLKFAKGRDGGTYIDAIAPGGSADKTGLFTVGDKVIATRYVCMYVCMYSFTCPILSLFWVKFWVKKICVPE